jgi:YjbE family integral membrane protein
MVESMMEPGFYIKLLQIIWIDILLAGDNAVVIAMACRNLHGTTRRWGIILGAGVAILLRIIFAGVITTLITIPGLKIAGGLALIYIAVELLMPQKHGEEDSIEGASTLWRAIRTIAIADLVMSLDNVIAIAGVAQGDLLLLGLGLAISIPLVIGGATLITAAIDKFPIIIWAGAALLGWIAGHMVLTDPFVVKYIGVANSVRWHYPVAILGALIVLAIGYLMRKRHEGQGKTMEERAETVSEEVNKPSPKP